jgi:malonyl-CoA O-methyltransferase
MKGLLARLLPRRASLLPADEAYALWAPTYPARPHNPLMQAEQVIVAPLLRSTRARRALDVGTGTGRNLALLREAGVPLVVGVDLSEAMLACADGSFARIRGDACGLPFRSGAFDVVSSSLMCGDIADLDAFIGEASRVLAVGGQLVYSDFHPSWTALGWRRTFAAADGHRYELAYCPHAIEEHLQLLDAHDIDICAIREPRVDGRGAPVVVVFHGSRRMRTRV